MSVKLISGWSNHGGSTVHHINLTNLLNEAGIECTFYGPHTWHLGKCKGELQDKFFLEEDDILISHFVGLAEKPKCKKHILSCHETNMFPLKDYPLEVCDVVHFVSDFQRGWHGVEVSSVVIPPIVTKVNWVNPNNNIAGVIGSIDSHKQVHKSIQRALDDGYKKVILFGDISDIHYFGREVSEYASKGQVILAGHEDDREAMYGKISEVYHSSIRETYGLVEAECRLSGIPFNGPSNNQDILEKEEILERWKKVLN